MRKTIFFHRKDPDSSLRNILSVSLGDRLSISFPFSNKGMEIDSLFPRQTARLSPRGRGGPDPPVEIDSLCRADNFQDKDVLFPKIS
jgi:hypothetical protein